MSSGRASLVMDICPNNYVKRTFIAVTIHYQKKAQVMNLIVGLKLMDIQKTAATNVLNKLNMRSNSFEINTSVNIKFVTDRERCKYQ